MSKTTNLQKGVFMSDYIVKIYFATDNEKRVLIK